MTFTSGSMTSANPASDLYTARASALTTAGFTLVDTQVISTRTHKVWKSAAANNSQGLDWYLDVAYTTTGAGSVWLGAFEGYTSPNGLRGPYSLATDLTTPESTFYTRFGATASALETNWTHVVNNTAQIQVQTTAYAYWISATTDRVIAMTSVAPTTVNYCGLFDMYTPWANKIGALAYPLITCSVTRPDSQTGTAHFVPGSSQPCALTRRPPVATLNTTTNIRYNSTTIYCAANEVALTTGNIGSGYGASNGYVDIGSSSFYDALRGARLGITNGWDSTNTAVFIGLLKDIAVFGGSAVTRGDTVSISGTNWVLSNLATNRCYGFKAA